VTNMEKYLSITEISELLKVSKKTAKKILGPADLYVPAQWGQMSARWSEDKVRKIFKM
jgi:hypothetical protein